MLGNIRLVRTHPDARLPSRHDQQDVGYDLFSIRQGRILPGETVAVNTGWMIADFALDAAYMQVHSRSSMALRSLYTVGGVIDPGYRGELIVLLHNGSLTPQDISAGDRIAQLVMHRVVDPCEMRFVEVDPMSVKATMRGGNGFGSSGK